MFKLTTDRIIQHWPTKVSVPIDHGETRTYHMSLDLKIIDTARFQALAKKGDTTVLPEVIVGWSDIQDEAGNELEFNPENLNAACKNPHFAQAAFGSYVQASSGRAAEKN